LLPERPDAFDLDGTSFRHLDCSNRQRAAARWL
jgi:hypothetical protein